MIRVDLVTKEYGGLPLPGRPPVRALDGVSLSIEAGTAVGVVGLNGAGKSTLLRLLLGYVRPTSGTVRIDGLAPRAYAQRYGIAYVPERVAVPRRWTVRGALTAYAMLGNLADDAHDRIARALRRLGLDPLANRRVGTLSKGNLQRLAIAQTLLAERALLVLDEPSDGLDPVWIAELRTIVGEWRAQDPRRVVVLASHQLSEVERLCERAIVLHEGRARAHLDLRAEGRSPLEDTFLRLVSEWGVRS